MAEKRNAPATVTEWYPFGFSGAGVNIVANDKASIATVRDWLHQAEVAQPTIDALRTEIDQLRQRVGEVEFELDMKTAHYEERIAYTIIHNGVGLLCSEGLYSAYSELRAKLALAEQDARRWRDRWVDYRTAYWRPTQPYEQARFLAESEAIDLENKFQEAHDRRAAIGASQGPGALPVA